MKDFKSAAFIDVRLGDIDIKRSDLADGSTIIESNIALEPYPRCITERLKQWAEQAPERTFIAKRSADGSWQKLSYAQTYSKVRAVSQALLTRGLDSERSVVILSENSLEHMILALAAMHVGIPYAPISPPYALLSQDFGKLRHCLRLMTPGLVFVSDGNAYERALKMLATEMPEAELVVLNNPPETLATTAFAELLSTSPGEAVEQAFQAITPDTVAKILFTSGSTGQPKGVINTQRLWCANLQQNLQGMPFLNDTPPLLVDWLPWNHTFGNNSNAGLTLYTGGSLYIDEGKPSPAGITQTVANLKELSPTIYFNVPKGYESLIPYFEQDEALRESFFKRLKLLFYAGAGLAQPVWDALERLAVETIGKRIPITTGLGMTESGPSALFANWPNGFSGLLGVPVSGIKIKLVPNEGKLEVRYKGPNVTPGYWREPELSAKAFDDDGYFITGDAIRFLDEHDPNKGMLFDGRVAEDFKLSTGTWVNAGIMRAKLNSKGAPLIQDAVMAGRDQSYLAALLFLNLGECKKRVPDSPTLTDGELLEHPIIRESLKTILQELQKESTGSSNRFERFMVAQEPPSLELGEITDKGSLNQRKILELRAPLIAKLYQNPAPAQVITGEGL